MVSQSCGTGSRRGTIQPWGYARQRQGVLEDDQEAVKWYRKAAEQGNASAQFNLADMYANGKGDGGR